MSTQIDWTVLVCNSCSASTEFVRRTRLKYKEGAGTVEEPTGYACRQCNADVDTGALIQRAGLERKRRELRALEAEVRDAEPMKPESTKPAPVASGPR